MTELIQLHISSFPSKIKYRLLSSRIQLPYSFLQKLNRRGFLCSRFYRDICQHCQCIYRNKEERFCLCYWSCFHDQYNILGLYNNKVSICGGYFVHFLIGGWGVKCPFSEIPCPCFHDQVQNDLLTLYGLDIGRMGRLIKLQEQTRKAFLYLVVVVGVFGNHNRLGGTWGSAVGTSPILLILFEFTNLVVVTDLVDIQSAFPN